MPNGYKIIEEDGLWFLICGYRKLPDAYDSKSDAHDAALEKAPCEAGGEPPKQVLEPQPEKENPDPSGSTPKRSKLKL